MKKLLLTSLLVLGVISAEAVNREEVNLRKYPVPRREIFYTDNFCLCQLFLDIFRL